MTGYNALEPDTRDGYPVVYNRHDPWTGRSFALYGEYSELECALLRALLHPGDVALAIGANVGWLAVQMAQRVGPTGAVLAFEPQRPMYLCCCANIALRSLANCLPFHAAVGNARGSIAVPMLALDQENNFGGLSLAAGSPHLVRDGQAPPSESVRILPVDDLNLRRVHLLQADVEGMELEVLKGATQTIATHRPILYLEADRAYQRAGLLEWLDDAGYVTYWHTPPLYNPANHKGKRENVFTTPDGAEPIASINWLALPAEHQGDWPALRRVERGVEDLGPREAA